MWLFLRLTGSQCYITRAQSEKGVSHSVLSDSLWPREHQPTRLLCPLDSPGKNTGVGCHSLLQGRLPDPGWNLGLLHCRQILYHLAVAWAPHPHPIVICPPGTLPFNPKMFPTYLALILRLKQRGISFLLPPYLASLKALLSKSRIVSHCC